MLTRDGERFKLGMTLVADSGFEFYTDEKDWYVKEYPTCTFLYNKVNGTKLLLDTLYSSQGARTLAQIQHIQRAKDMMENEIYDLSMQRKPSETFFKARNSFQFG